MPRVYDPEVVDIVTGQLAESDGLELQIKQYTNPKQAAREAYYDIQAAAVAEKDFFRVVDLPDTRLLVSMNLQTQQGIDIIFMELTQGGDTPNAYMEVIPFLDEPFVATNVLAWRNNEGGLDYQFLGRTDAPSPQAQMFYKELKQTILGKGGRNVATIYNKNVTESFTTQ